MTSKEKNAAYQREYRQRNLARLRAYDRARSYKRRDNPSKALARARAYQRKHRLASYGITEMDVLDAFETQGGACKICGCRFTALPTDLRRAGSPHIDHCHKTGRFRGLLCTSCNTSLGKLGDDEKGLQRALDYVRDDVPAGTLEGLLF